MKELLVDYIPFNFSRELVLETLTKDPEKNLVVKGILQKAETKNQNGRVYPYDVLMREASKYQENYIKERRALGELDHPSTSVVNLQNVSHNILEIHWEGKDLVGTIEILPTPNGNILKELFKSNIRLGISSRGMGSVKKLDEDTSEVQNDFEIISWDFVSSPSTRGAYMFPVGQTAINESTSNNTNNSGKYEQIESIIRDILIEIR